ncbi:MAG: HD domain-containing protein, partial [Lachnospiraceae bacterium]|nr:HD domain-containing protein [Lachnospiraceae bacterium]
MEINKYLEVLHTIEKLKDTTRHCYTPGGRHESVAEHSWRITMMAYFLRDEFNNVDFDKVIKMCLIHDLGEIFTGDIPSFDKSAADESKEERLLTDWVNSLPEPYKTEMNDLYAEMEARVTTEARIYKALDNLEAVISHNESDLSTWIEKEYTLNRTYGDDTGA